jgi:hypothetical protein
MEEDFFRFTIISKAFNTKTKQGYVIGQNLNVDFSSYAFLCAFAGN